mgnify:CR=1 FL=1
MTLPSPSGHANRHAAMRGRLPLPIGMDCPGAESSCDKARRQTRRRGGHFDRRSTAKHERDRKNPACKREDRRPSRPSTSPDNVFCGKFSSTFRQDARSTLQRCALSTRCRDPRGGDRPAAPDGEDRRRTASLHLHQLVKPEISDQFSILRHQRPVLLGLTSDNSVPAGSCPVEVPSPAAWA